MLMVVHPVIIKLLPFLRAQDNTLSINLCLLPLFNYSFSIFSLIRFLLNSGTLFKYLDHCTTSSGKRLLKRWICHPLKDIEDINDRLNVVEGLIKNSGISSIISEYLRRLPDIERLLGRVKASIGASSTLLLPFIGEKLLKQRVFLCLAFYIKYLLYFFDLTNKFFITGINKYASIIC